jgi:putative phosphoribosyl transferase
MEVTLSEEKARRAAGRNLSNVKISLGVPAKATRLIIFSLDSPGDADELSHGEIVRAFQKNRFATLTFTAPGKKKSRNGESISIAAQRLVAITEWANAHEPTRDLPMSYFGCYTGAAVSLLAAAELGHRVHSIVTCGGQLDLARIALNKIKAPTLLIVGGRDIPLINVNERAAQLLSCEKSLTIVPRASHFFEEPGALSTVSRIATEWFAKSFHGNNIFNHLNA